MKVCNILIDLDMRPPIIINKYERDILKIIPL